MITIKGFLIVDGSKNTLFIPNEDIQELFSYLHLNEIIKNVKQHKTFKELDTEIRNYVNMKGDYHES